MKNLYKFYLSVFILFTYTHILNAQPGWSQINPPSSTSSYSGIYFPNENTGLVLHYKTTNGGINWIDVLGGSGFIMFFPSLNTGYSTAGGIYKTTNLGTNWISQTNPSGANLYGLYFLNDNIGFASGDGATIIKTTNGGTNWTIIPTGVSTSYGFYGVYFFDVNTGFLAGQSLTNNLTSIILKTTNSGINWTSQSFGEFTGYEQIHFVNQNTGVVTGFSIAQTTDGGATWTPKTDPLSSVYYALYFPSAATGYAVGVFGAIIKTTNSGDSWFGQTSGTDHSLNSVYFINDNTGFICGDDGILLKTTDGGGPPIGIQQISNEIPKEYSLSQNYPNPFNPLTYIDFSISKKTFVKIIIYDIAGKIIDELVNFELNVGKYSIAWNASKLASGLYLYKLQTYEYTMAKKMLLIK